MGEVGGGLMIIYSILEERVYIKRIDRVQGHGKCQRKIIIKEHGNGMDEIQVVAAVWTPTILWAQQQFPEFEYLSVETSGVCLLHC